MYTPISSHGIIGNMKTIALVCDNGNIDWFCFPNFDSPSVFGGILDDKKGGFFKIAPTNVGVDTKQLYWPDTNVMVTRFYSSDGVAEVIDFMPVADSGTVSPAHQIVRMVKTVRGSMRFRMRCVPAFDYARQEHRRSIHGRRALFETPQLTLELLSNHDLRPHKSGCYAEFTLEEDQHVVFLMKEAEQEDPGDEGISLDYVQNLLNQTISFWQRWLSQCTYAGRWREVVYRSALVLKLLTFKPTGAIVAAPTCSLPETMGGSRNWDYRFTWIRDAAFTLYALMRIGFVEEAANFMQWVEQRCHELKPDGSLQIMYGIDGRHDLTEQVLPHLEGYRGSSPVRIGNDAFKQFQLDIYGELMDTAYLFNKYGTPISYDLWKQLTKLVCYVCENWHRPDSGIWEVRGGQQRFVYSQVMCWVALDRALRLADKRSFPADYALWTKIRDDIYLYIMKNGWDSQKKAFVQAVGSSALDAANMIMPLVFFLSPTDPRLLQTVDAVNRPPHKGGLVSDSLMYRYNITDGTNGMLGQEGTFNICTFWLVEALTRAGHFDKARLTEARLMFEKMLSYGNHLGLFSEETGPCGEALGNFPQALTHLSLISAAFNLDRALG